MNGLELDSDAGWPSTGKVLILQGNQMRKTQAAHSIASARFCGHCGNFKTSSRVSKEEQLKKSKCWQLGSHHRERWQLVGVGCVEGANGVAKPV